MEAVMKPIAAILTAALLMFTGPASAGALTVDLKPDAGNPVSPQMGDWLSFHTVIRNDGTTPVDGLIAWISLVETDRGKEQPVDLEDWSAHKAVTASSLGPGQTLETDWPVRLIQAGTYRVMVSAISRNGDNLAASPFADFTVRQKPVVESRRVLPVAFGVPLLIVAAILWRRMRHARWLQVLHLRTRLLGS
jgi:hypothetical protein